MANCDFAATNNLLGASGRVLPPSMARNNKSKTQLLRAGSSKFSQVVAASRSTRDGKVQNLFTAKAPPPISQAVVEASPRPRSMVTGASSPSSLVAVDPSSVSKRGIPVTTSVKPMDADLSVSQLSLPSPGTLEIGSVDLGSESTPETGILNPVLDLACTVEISGDTTPSFAVEGVNSGEKASISEYKSTPSENSNLRTWAAVAKGSSVIKEMGSPTEHVSGVPFVMIPSENIESAKVQFKDYVHACFRGHSPDMGRIIGIVNVIWAKSGPRIFVHRLSANCFLLKVVKQKSREIVLSRNVWNIAGQPMFVSPWSADFEPDPKPLTKAKVMVEFHGVPFLLFNDESLCRLATPVGKPVALAPETAKHENFEVAKVIVEVDLLRNLPTSLVSGLPNGKEFKVNITYPWLPPKCISCNEFGHDDIHCLKNVRPIKTAPYSSKHWGRSSRDPSRGRSRGPKPVKAWRVVRNSSHSDPEFRVEAPASTSPSVCIEVEVPASVTPPVCDVVPENQDLCVTGIETTPLAQLESLSITEIPEISAALFNHKSGCAPAVITASDAEIDTSDDTALDPSETEDPFILVTRRKSSRSTTTY